MPVKMKLFRAHGLDALDEVESEVNTLLEEIDSRNGKVIETNLSAFDLKGTQITMIQVTYDLPRGARSIG